MTAKISLEDTGLKAAVAVYCGASTGTKQEYADAARSVGKAIALQNRRLVYGGGSKGIMGIVSGAALEHGGKVTGVVPYAMVISGGEKAKGDAEKTLRVDLEEQGREMVETIVVQSMHERKVEMAKRVDGFVGLPGGFGTFEEVLEVTTWTQLGIHDKPIVLVNVLGFWDPLRHLIQNSTTEGFINTKSQHIITFVDGPANINEQSTFNWGDATLEALDSWTKGHHQPLFDWSQTLNGKAADGKLNST